MSGDFPSENFYAAQDAEAAEYLHPSGRQISADVEAPLETNAARRSDDSGIQFIGFFVSSDNEPMAIINDSWFNKDVQSQRTDVFSGSSREVTPDEQIGKVKTREGKSKPVELVNEPIAMQVSGKRNVCGHSDLRKRRMKLEYRPLEPLKLRTDASKSMKGEVTMQPQMVTACPVTGTEVIWVPSGPGSDYPMDAAWKAPNSSR